MRNKYNNDIYSMYEEEFIKREKLEKETKYLKLENKIIKDDFNNLKDNFTQKLNFEVEKATSQLIKENTLLSNKLTDAYEEIDRLKSQIENKDYNIDKLEASIHKDSTNSGIPTSKEIGKNKHIKTGANTYNHRGKSYKNSGGQFGHKGETLTKEK